MNRLSRKQRIEVVLHEQAHRIKARESKHDDERFIIAWAQTLTDHLFGEKPIADIQHVIEAAKIPANDTPSTDMMFRLAKSSGTVTIEKTIELTKEDIHHVQNNGGLEIQIHPNSVSKLGLPENLPLARNSAPVLRFDNGFWAGFVLESIEENLETSQRVKLPIRIQLKIRTEQDSNGLRNYSIADTRFDIASSQASGTERRKSKSRRRGRPWSSRDS